MSSPSVSVAVPTLDGAGTLDATLAAVRRQSVAAELVVLDSSSSDETREIAAGHGALVHVVARAWFGHGRARNRLMELTTAPRVAFLTQDSEPADAGWLARLLAHDEALVYGPYRARPGAAASIRREYDAYFGAMPARAYAACDLGDPPHPGPATFVSSANLCLRRDAWARVPFRDVAYAEDQWLGIDLLRAGERKRYVPEAAVLHSHDYSPVQRLRRCFDEARALQDVYGWIAPAAPRTLVGTVRAEVRRDRLAGARTTEAVTYHAARVLGQAVGTRAARLPASARRRLSLEGRP